MTVERKASMTTKLHVDSPPPFLYERDLVNAFVEFISQNDEVFGIESFALEFDYRRGRTDVVALSEEGHVIAFEAKLRDWREALHQAYRNTCFAAESYILMPPEAAHRAAAHVNDFVDRGIGICTIAKGAIRIIQPAPRRPDVLEPWLERRAVEFASSSASEE
jgi:hypothetical protein